MIALIGTLAGCNNSPSPSLPSAPTSSTKDVGYYLRHKNEIDPTVRACQKQFKSGTDLLNTTQDCREAAGAGLLVGMAEGKM
jgi:hypothetical protein